MSYSFEFSVSRQCQVLLRKATLHGYSHIISTSTYQNIHVLETFSINGVAPYDMESRHIRKYV